MQVSSRQLINSYISERRVTKRIPTEEVINSLLNVYKKEFKREFTHGIYDEGPTISIVMKLSGEEDKRVSNPFPGIYIDKDDQVSTSEFEEKYLKKFGWTVWSAVYSLNPVFSMGARLEGKRLNLMLEPSSRVQTKVKKPEFLYHIAPRKFESSISKRGLIPKSTTYRSGLRYSEPRIFFTTDKPREWSASEYTEIEGPTTIFRLDTRKFSRFNLHKDWTDSSVTDSAVFTRTHIPAQALSIVDRFD